MQRSTAKRATDANLTSSFGENSSAMEISHLMNNQPMRQCLAVAASSSSYEASCLEVPRNRNGSMRHGDISADIVGEILQHSSHATTTNPTTHEASNCEAPINESGSLNQGGSLVERSYCGDRGENASTNSSESSISKNRSEMNLVCNYIA